MKKAFIFLVLSVLAFPLRANAGIDLPYTSSALTCSDFTQTNNYSGPTGCDNVLCYGGWQCDPTHGMEINSAANYPGGEGGKGFRVWYGDGNNQNSAVLNFQFNSEPTELWTRHYVRWQTGFNGAGIWQKMLYLYPNPNTVQAIFDITGLGPNGCVFTAQGSGGGTCYAGSPNAFCPAGTWKASCGGDRLGFDGTNHSDGSWHPIEFHYKANTAGQSNGVFEAWLNDVLVFSKTGINWGGGGVHEIKFPSNNKTLSNGGCAYYDQDDFAFSTTGRIGPLGGGGGGTTAPTNLSATAVSSLQIDLTWTAPTGAVGVTGYNIYRGGLLISTSATNSYSNTGLNPNTQYTYTVAAYDAAGNLLGQQSSSATAMTPLVATGTPNLFTEHFDDSSFASRGWYDTDATSTSISTVEKYSGVGSYECAWTVGGTGCSGGTPKRYLITPSEELYVTYYVKHSANFEGSGSVNHPHLFYILSDLDGIYDSLSVNFLTTYIEENWGSARTSGVLRLSTQDSKNIPHYQTQTPAQQNLVGVTENRDVSGCSGTLSPDSPSSVDCYWASPTWRNGKSYNSPAVFTSGNKNAWHKVTTHLKMNSISNGIAVADGKAEFLLDDVLQYGNTNVVYRTGQHPTMKWKQFVLSPYIGVGSPVAQTIWIDELNISDSPPGTSIKYPQTPVIQGVTP